MPDVREVYEMVTKQKPPESGALERQQKRQVRSARNKKVGAFVAAAAIGLAAIALILARPGQDTTTPADEPSTVYPVDPSAVAVAGEFVDAFGDFDGERAITYLADNPFLEMDATTPEEVPVFTSFLEAMGYKQILVDPCWASGSSASGTAVRCRFDWHGIRSDEIGLGPYPGSWDLTVRDGKIGSVALHWNIDKFSAQMWEPFRDWMRTTSPKDSTVMYVDGGGNFELTEPSIRLWEQHTREYVKAVQRGTAGQ